MEENCREPEGVEGRLRSQPARVSCDSEQDNGALSPTTRWNEILPIST